MLRPEQLIRAVIELIFMLLGGLVVWLGLTNQIFSIRANADVDDSERGADCVGARMRLRGRRAGGSKESGGRVAFR